MSYILEALKKDEATSDAAAAAALTLAQSRPKRSWAPWVLGIALVVNATALGYLFFPRSDDPVGGLSRSSPPLSQPEAAREVAVRPRQRVAPPGQQAPRTAASARQPAPAREIRDRTAAAAAQTAARPESSASTGGRVLSPEEAASLNLLPQDSAAVGTPATRAGETVIAPSQRPEPTAAAAAAAEKPNTEDRSTRIIQLAELPPSDRQDFPKLEFSTHIFADDPALRAVVVNSRRLSEGESIGEMVLRAVTEEGILVDYRGYRVAVSVIEEWN